MLNNEVFRATTDKQTHKHTKHKHTYRVKTEETFFYLQVFVFNFRLKRRFPTTSWKTKRTNSKYNNFLNDSKEQHPKSPRRAAIGTDQTCHVCRWPCEWRANTFELVSSLRISTTIQACQLTAIHCLCFHFLPTFFNLAHATHSPETRYYREIEPLIDWRIDRYRHWSGKYWPVTQTSYRRSLSHHWSMVNGIVAGHWRDPPTDWLTD